MRRNYQFLGMLWMENPAQHCFRIHFPAQMIKDEESKSQDFEKRRRAVKGGLEARPHATYWLSSSIDWLQASPEKCPCCRQSFSCLLG